MNKVVALMLLLCAFACGAHEEYASEVGFLPEEPRKSAAEQAFENGEEVHYGTAQQPIFLLNGYGSEATSSAPRCIPPWGGGECQVPDRRDWKITVIESGGDSNCGTTVAGSTMGTAVAQARADIATITNNNGWITQQLGNNSALGTLKIRCTGDSSGAPGSTSASGWDCHDTSNGELCQYASTTVTVRLGVIQGLTAYQQASTATRTTFLYNVLMHELGHVIGFGHTSGNMGTLMNTPAPNAPVANTLDPWDQKLSFQADEIHMIDCYRESSGTSPDCPNP